MEDLIPLLIFAVISALSGLAKKKGKKNSDELEELSELDLPPNDPRTVGPPPLSYEERLFKELKERVQDRSATREPPRSSEEERQRKEVEKPIVLDDTLLASQKEKEIEEAKRKQQLAIKKLEEVREKTKSKKKIESLSSVTNTKDFFNNPRSIRQGFVTSLIFDKPVSLKENRDY